MKLKKYEDDHNLTMEELMLLREAADDRLNINPLDAKALSDYNYYSNLIMRLENA